MKMHNNLFLFLVTLGLVALSVPARGENIRYTFTLVADGGVLGATFGTSAPAINDVGTLAIVASLNNPPFQAILTGNGGPLTTIVTPPTGLTNQQALINSSGTVAFSIFGSSILTGNGGPLTLIYSRPIQGGTIALGGFNDAGTVGFADQDPTGHPAVLTGTGGPVTTLYNTTSGPFSVLLEPDINNAGTVAFRADLLSGGAGIFRGDGGPLTTIADTNGPFSNFSFGTPAINIEGTVAFTGFLKTGGEAIAVGSGGPLTIIADTSGPFRIIGIGSEAINDSGTVAFGADLAAGGIGIFTGPDPIADKVITAGDPLFGSTVTGLNFGRGLNNAGQLAFSANLADGRQVEVRANPIPEPSTVMLLGTSLIGWIGYRWRGSRVTAHSFNQQVQLTSSRRFRAVNSGTFPASPECNPSPWNRNP
jgi:hypothetical protein